MKLEKRGELQQHAQLMSPPVLAVLAETMHPGVMQLVSHAVPGTLIKSAVDSDFTCTPDVYTHRCGICHKTAVLRLQHLPSLHLTVIGM